MKNNQYVKSDNVYETDLKNVSLKQFREKEKALYGRKTKRSFASLLK